MQMGGAGLCLCLCAASQPPEVRDGQPLAHLLPCTPSQPSTCLQASVLEYAKHLAEVSVEGSPITDCVLTVPASFTQQQVGGGGQGGEPAACQLCLYRAEGSRSSVLPAPSQSCFPKLRSTCSLCRPLKPPS